MSSEPRRVTRPMSLIYTLYGDFVHRDPASRDELWIGALVHLMGEFGLSEAAVRQAVSRMSHQGWLAARRLGNRSAYAVTERGRARIDAISPRIYGPLAEWDGRWRMLTYSVPESRRDGRDRLRKDLVVLGWAPLSASTWVTPSGNIETARSAAQALNLIDRIDLFVGEYHGPSSDRDLVTRCWDLDAIAGRYAAFIATYAPRLAAERIAPALDDAHAFLARMWLVHDYRKFAYVDPGLPSVLLPAPWPGSEAAGLFRSYYALLSRRAERFYQAAARPNGGNDALRGERLNE
ncbi:MAG: PaaX family transcriptional regulator [Vulcanimicrobiaceae bacterium]